MRALVLGKGNLGRDLQDVSEEVGVETTLLSRSTGWDFPQNEALARVLLDTHEKKYDWIFCCVGAGSVEAAEKEYAQSLMVHCVLPAELLTRAYDRSRIVLFSTDYVCDPQELYRELPNCHTQRPLSLYAQTKLAMEYAFRTVNRPGSMCVRVGSLYGKHFPERNLAEKIALSYKNGSRTFVNNRVSPTPSRWVAENVVQHLMKSEPTHAEFHHCAPCDDISVFDFARFVLGPIVQIQDGRFDEKRPRASGITNSLGPQWDWQPLWEEYHRRLPSAESPT